MISALLDRALAALDGDATALRTRLVRVRAFGGFRRITATVGLWRLLDEMARDRATSSDALCRQALAAFPDAIPGEAVWLFLCRETPKPEPPPPEAAPL